MIGTGHPHMLGFGTSPELATESFFHLLNNGDWAAWHLCSEITVIAVNPEVAWFMAGGDIERNV